MGKHLEVYIISRTFQFHTVPATIRLRHQRTILTFSPPESRYRRVCATRVSTKLLLAVFHKSRYTSPYKGSQTQYKNCTKVYIKNVKGTRKILVIQSTKNVIGKEKFKNSERFGYRRGVRFVRVLITYSTLAGPEQQSRISAGCKKPLF
jgi:hypothetical protein